MTTARQWIDYLKRKQLRDEWLPFVEWLRQQTTADCRYILSVVESAEDEPGRLPEYDEDNPAPVNMEDYDMNIDQMYPRRMLTAKIGLTQPMLILITGIEQMELRAGMGKQPEPKWVVFYENVSKGKPEPMPLFDYTKGRGYSFVMRKTLAQSIAEILGAKETDEWVGKKIVLFAAPSIAGAKGSMSIFARAPKQSAPVEAAKGDKADKPAPMPEAVAVAPAVATDETGYENAHTITGDVSTRETDRRVVLSHVDRVSKSGHSTEEIG